MTDEFSYLHSLNEGQREAVESLEGAVLVLAGAGTGKTRVLITRIAHLLYTHTTHIGAVLAVTFTNKAAREMKERLEKLLERPVEGFWLGTFHSLAARILRVHSNLVGLESQFTILDDDDQRRLLKQLILDAGIDEKRWSAKALQSIIARWKDKGLSPSQLGPQDKAEWAQGKAVELYVQYQERLLLLNACDFGDLILLNLKLFQENPDILRSYQNRFTHILVDEYQDTNTAQYLWLRLLAMGHHNLCCVGDDDQSIYGWRGAEVGNILRFEKDFPGAKIVRLEKNYRSTGHILGAASGLIAHNEGRLGKELWTDDELGLPVVVSGVWDAQEEARQIGDKIEDRQRKGQSLSQMAILVRASFLMRVLEEKLLMLGIPYRVVGGPRFYERQEIRDALAYLRVISSPDHDLALERIINVPKRGIGKTTLQKLYQQAREQECSLYVLIKRLVAQDALKGAVGPRLKAFIEQLDHWRELAKTLPHPELAEQVLIDSGYVEFWKQEKTADAAGRLENLTELTTSMGEFETLEEFLEYVSLTLDVIESGNPSEMLTLMTLHAAKGLEFETLFLPGWEEGVFPSQRTVDESGVKGLEEERRLAYVGITRARKELFISFAANRQIYGQYTPTLPSRFLEELPSKNIERSNDMGLGSFEGYSPYKDGQAQKGRHWNAAYNRPSFQTEGSKISGFLKEKRASRGQKKVIFKTGDRIFHQKLGYGEVQEVEGDKLTITFEHSGDKTIFASFVEKQ